MNNIKNVGKHTNTEYQKRIFDILNTQTLNELLNRIEYGIFDKHSKYELSNNDISNIKIKSVINKNNKGDINIYINFNDKIGSYAHISVYLKGINFSSYVAGPLHLSIGYKSPYIHLKILPFRQDLTSNRLILKYSKYNVNKKYTYSDLINNHQEYNIILQLLERYFTKNDMYSLYNTLSNKYTNHKYLSNIVSYRKTKHLPIKERKINLTKTKRRKIKIKIHMNPKIRLSKTIKKHKNNKSRKQTRTGKFNAFIDDSSNNNTYNNLESIHNSNLNDIENISYNIKNVQTIKRKQPKFLSKSIKISNKNLNIL